MEADGRADRGAPWTVKGVRPETRNAIKTAAERQGMTVSEWLDRMARQQIQADRQAARAPVPVSPPPRACADLEELDRLVAMARSMAEATHKPVPRSVARPVYRAMRERLEEIQGSPERGAGQTG